jgi:transcriptional regulator with XRE-family HTH domain
MMFHRRAMQRFGLRVVEARQKLDLTQEQLAERVGMSRRQMNRVESGAANVSLSKLIEISVALKVETSDLFAPPSKSTVRRSGRPPARGVKRAP